MKQPKTARERAVAFFAANAAYSFDPKTETRRQGQMRTARLLAAAEANAANEGWYYDWCRDVDGCQCEPPATDHRVMYCELWSQADTLPLASLSGICTPSQDYMRVIEAELALQAINGRENN